MPMQEEWRKVPIIEFANDYLVSNLGNVYSLHNNRNLTPILSKTGYYRVHLSRNNYHRQIAVHRLVALAFIPNPENKPTVNHIDECKTNNVVDNLEWATNLEQNTHGTRIARAVSHTDYKARNIDYKEVAAKHDYNRNDMCGRQQCAVYKDGNLVAICRSQKEAGILSGVSFGKVSACVLGHKKSCKGYSFKAISDGNPQF